MNAPPNALAARAPQSGGRSRGGPVPAPWVAEAATGDGGRPGAGRTWLHVERSVAGGRPVVRSGASGPPGRPVLRPVLVSSSGDAARVCLMPEGALLLAGDEVEVTVEVGPGAALEIVEPAGTVAYAMHGGRARWDVRIHLRPGARFVWAGEPFVVAEGARVDRTTSVVLGQGALLALRESLVLGRHGEAPGYLHQRLDVHGADGTPVVVEDLLLDHRTAMPGLLGPARAVASLLALGVGDDLGEPDDPTRFLLAGDRDVWWRRTARDLHRATLADVWPSVAAAVLGGGDHG